MQAGLMKGTDCAQTPPPQQQVGECAAIGVMATANQPASLLPAPSTSASPCRQSIVGGKVGDLLRSSFELTGDETVEGYHGTTAENAVQILKFGFQPSATGMLGRGIYWSDDVRKARPYVRDKSGTVLQMQIRTGRTKTVDRRDHPSRLQWNQDGYDSAWVPAHCGMVPSGLSENCTYDPARIKVTAVSTDFGQSFTSVDSSQCLAILVAHIAANEERRKKAWQERLRRRLEWLGLGTSRAERAAESAAAHSAEFWLVPIVSGALLALYGGWCLYSDITSIAVLIGGALFLIGSIGFQCWWGHSPGPRHAFFLYFAGIYTFIATALFIVGSTWCPVSGTVPAHGDPTDKQWVQALDTAGALEREYGWSDRAAAMDCGTVAYGLAPAMSWALLAVVCAACSELVAMGLLLRRLPQRPIAWLRGLSSGWWACLLLFDGAAQQAAVWSLTGDWGSLGSVIAVLLWVVAVHGFDYAQWPMTKGRQTTAGAATGLSRQWYFRYWAFFFTLSGIIAADWSLAICPAAGTAPTAVVNHDMLVRIEWLHTREIARAHARQSRSAAPPCTDSCHTLTSKASSAQSEYDPLINDTICRDGGRGSTNSLHDPYWRSACPLGSDTIDCGCRNGTSIADWLSPLPEGDMGRDHQYGWSDRWETYCGSVVAVVQLCLALPTLLGTLWCVCREFV